jgi:hypothetical protein
LKLQFLQYDRMGAFYRQYVVGDPGRAGRTRGQALREPRVHPIERQRRQRVLSEAAFRERAGDEGGNLVDGSIVRFRAAGDNGKGREKPISPALSLAASRCLHHNPSYIPFPPQRMRLPSFSKIASVPFVAGLLIGVVGTAGAATVLGSDVFRDVPSGSYYDRAVGEMYDIGVIKGNPDGSFNPGGYVTRADVAVMLQRLRDEMTGNVSSSSRSSSSRSSSSSTSSSSSSSSTASSLNPKGTIRFTTSEIRVPENISTKKVTVAVVRTGGATGEVTMKYTTGGGTATVDSDYNKSSGTLTFEGGDTSQTFDIVIKDDGSSEGNETIIVTLSDPAGGASLGTPAALTVIITDDESTSSSSSSSTSSSSSSKGPTVGLSATQYSVDEDGGTVTITVTRAGSSSSSAAVNYATSNGTAKSGDEYTATSGTISFSSGETSKSFTVPVFNDTSDDGSKTFNVTLTSPTGATLGSGLNTAVVTINDDETLAFGSGSFKFSRSTYAVTESSGEAVLTVQRTGGSAFAASVSFSTTSLTASSGADYTATSGTLNFAAGEAAKIIVIPIAKDTVADTSETFAVDLASPTGNVPLISPYSATVTIE